METVFIAGSISIKTLDEGIRERIEHIMSEGNRIIVGDADGVDRSVQRLLDAKHYQSVVVYCSGDTPRNNIGGWPIVRIDTDARPGTRAFFTAKDVQMADDCDSGLMIWDSQSIGTLSNTVELLKRKKTSQVYINETQTILNVQDVGDLEQLIRCMNDAARARAEKTIRITEKIEKMSHKQYDMFDFSS